MKLGMGFTTFSSSAIFYANCRAYGNTGTSITNARGFNCEGSEDVHYVNCSAGGRAAEGTNPFFSDQQALGTHWVRLFRRPSGRLRRVQFVVQQSRRHVVDNQSELHAQTGQARP